MKIELENSEAIYAKDIQVPVRGELITPEQYQALSRLLGPTVIPEGHSGYAILASIAPSLWARCATNIDTITDAAAVFDSERGRMVLALTLHIGGYHLHTVLDFEDAHTRQMLERTKSTGTVRFLLTLVNHTKWLTYDFPLSPEDIDSLLEIDIGQAAPCSPKEQHDDLMMAVVYLLKVKTAFVGLGAPEAEEVSAVVIEY